MVFLESFKGVVKSFWCGSVRCVLKAFQEFLKKILRVFQEYFEGCLKQAQKECVK